MRNCSVSGRSDFGIFVGEYSGEPLFADPLGILNFLRVDRDIAIKGSPPATEHKGCRERPGLTCKIADLSHPYSCLFKDLAADSRLDRFTRLDETGQQGIHPLGPSRRPAKKDVVAMGDQHDDHRIGSGKVMAATGGTIPLPTCHRERALGPAAGTVAVGLVPAQNRLGRRGKLGFAGIKAGHHSAKLCKLCVSRQGRMALLSRVKKRAQRGQVDVLRLPR